MTLAAHDRVQLLIAPLPCINITELNSRRFDDRRSNSFTPPGWTLRISGVRECRRVGIRDFSVACPPVVHGVDRIFAFFLLLGRTLALFTVVHD